MAPRSSIHLGLACRDQPRRSFRAGKTKRAAKWNGRPPANDELNLVRSPRWRSVLTKSVLGDHHSRREPVVHADLDLADIGFVGQQSGAVGRKCRVPSEREVVILSLGRPVLAEVELGAVAERPAYAGIVCGAETRRDCQGLVAAIEGKQSSGRPKDTVDGR